MRTVHWLIMGILCLVASSCDSNDEPEMPYSGPWAISYTESFNWMRNTSSDFHDWFEEHSNDFQAASLEMSNGSYWNWQGDCILWTDYDKAVRGYVQWIEIANDISEDEVKAKVERFNAFSIEDKKNSAYDRFEAEYQRYDGK